VKLTTDITPKGVKVYDGENHIKTYPIKFYEVFKPKHIIIPNRIRLTLEERFLLEVSIYEQHLKLECPLVYNLIKRSTPVNVRKVFPKDGPHYFLLAYKNGIRIKCPKPIYNVGFNAIESLFEPTPKPFLQTKIA